MMQWARAVGVIKWFSPDKGYGFVQTPDRDYFAHVSQCGDYEPVAGDQVQFSVGAGRDGRPSAQRIVKVTASEAR